MRMVSTYYFALAVLINLRGLLFPFAVFFTFFMVGGPVDYLHVLGGPKNLAQLGFRVSFPPELPAIVSDVMFSRLLMFVI